MKKKLKFILEQTDTETVKNIWLNLSKMYEINKDTALGGILFKATENKVLELTKNKENGKKHRYYCKQEKISTLSKNRSDGK